MSITFTAAAFTGEYYAPVTDGPELNMANGNAGRVLDLLGYGEEDYYAGSCEPQEFLGRILIAQALLPVATDDERGRPDVVDGNAVYCGTAPGYLAGRLHQLEDLATWARQRRLTVTWC